MAIPQSQYVDISSVVGGATQVPGREFIARVFTDNPLLPPQTYVEFLNADDVAAYFGISSQEYLRAAFYFAYISKTGTAPTKISFGRWVDEATQAEVFGYVGAVAQALTSYSSISNGSIGVTFDGTYHSLTGLDFTGAANLNDVATVLQTAIAAAVTGSTVVYSPSTNNFILSAGTAGAHTVSIQDGVGGTNISQIVNWLPAATIVNGKFTPGTNAATTAPGSAVETPVQAVTTSAAFSTNFGSFCFMPKQLALTLTASSPTVSVSDTAALTVGMSVEGDGIPLGTVINAISANTSITLSHPATLTGASTLSFFLSLAQAVTLANWTKAANVTYIYQLSVNQGNAMTWQTGLAGIAGTGINLESGLTNEYIEMMPMAIQAATDYSLANSVVNYEFSQHSALAPSVTTLTLANTYNGLSINYYGQTQSAGALINFYQQGVLQGLSTDPTDNNTFANEIWLKDAMGAGLLNLLLAVSQVPVNNQGLAMLYGTMQIVINQALFNGTIEVGKTLTALQKVYIGQITNDVEAWQSVQNQGYWRAAVFVAQNTTPVTYKAKYILVYSKDDVIRKVEGLDVLI